MKKKSFIQLIETFFLFEAIGWKGKKLAACLVNKVMKFFFTIKPHISTLLEKFSDDAIAWIYVMKFSSIYFYSTKLYVT